MVIFTPRGDAALDDVIIVRWDPAFWGDLGEFARLPWLQARWGRNDNGALVAAHALTRWLHPDMNEEVHVPGVHRLLLNTPSTEMAIDMLHQLHCGSVPVNYASVECITGTTELTLHELHGPLARHGHRPGDHTGARHLRHS